MSSSSIGTDVACANTAASMVAGNSTYQRRWYANEIVTDKLLAIAASYDINVKTGSRARTEHTTCHRQWSVQRAVTGRGVGRRSVSPGSSVARKI